MASHCHTVRKLVGLQSKHLLSEVAVQPTTSMTVETMEENLAMDSAALEAVPMNSNYLPLIVSHLPPHRHQTTTMMKCYDHPILSSTCQRKANDSQRSTERKYTKNKEIKFLGPTPSTSQVGLHWSMRLHQPRRPLVYVASLFLLLACWVSCWVPVPLSALPLPSLPGVPRRTHQH